MKFFLKNHQTCDRNVQHVLDCQFGIVLTVSTDLSTMLVARALNPVNFEKEVKAYYVSPVETTVDSCLALTYFTKEVLKIWSTSGGVETNLVLISKAQGYIWSTIYIDLPTTRDPTSITFEAVHSDPVGDSITAALKPLEVLSGKCMDLGKFSGLRSTCINWLVCCNITYVTRKHPELTKHYIFALF